MNKIIEVENLRKIYGKVIAVDKVSFSVEKGEIFGLLGPNGAGKTTTVECLQGLRHDFSGTVKVLGLDPRKEAHALRQKIGSQLQQSALPDRIKVWEALDMFATFTRNASDWHILIEQWGISDKRKASFSSLSGGQKQRLFITLALVNNPQLVFLDEMTTGLDPAGRRAAWELIKAVRDQGKTVVLVTHFMDEAEHLCDRLAVINHGKVIAMDTPSALINKYAPRIKVTFTTNHQDLSWLKQIPQVQNINRSGTHVVIEGEGPVLALVASELVKHNIIPNNLHVEQSSLEDVFLTLTNREENS